VITDIVSHGIPGKMDEEARMGASEALWPELTFRNWREAAVMGLSGADPVNLEV
jgi:hypothetical protein